MVFKRVFSCVCHWLMDHCIYTWMTSIQIQFYWNNEYDQCRIYVHQCKIHDKSGQHFVIKVQPRLDLFSFSLSFLFSIFKALSSSSASGYALAPLAVPLSILFSNSFFFSSHLTKISFSRSLLSPIAATLLKHCTSSNKKNIFFLFVLCPQPSLDQVISTSSSLSCWRSSSFSRSPLGHFHLSHCHLLIFCLAIEGLLQCIRPGSSFPYF